MTRRMGVEEEFLIVDGGSGHPLPLGEVLEQLSDFPRLTSEMKQEQIETCTLPRILLAELADDISAGRKSADAAARRAGARAAALATSPLPVESTIAPGERCAQLMERFGLTAVEQLTGGCHVHVEIESEEEGVAILDRIRIWLPVLLAISANSPYWNDVDSSYASYRWQAWSRWPTTGAADIYGSAADYHREMGQILSSGVPLDKANLYLDARLSHKHPTVEVRVADVCLFADDTVLLAALVRGLAETAARQWRDGMDPVPASARQLQLASWQASRYGLEGELADPLTGKPRAAFEVVTALLEDLRPVLEEQGEFNTVEFLLFQVLSRGTGAAVQRESYARGASTRDVVADAVRITSLAATPLRAATAANDLHQGAQ
jgi:glutamate---cysteine ligase / carboxylate-amine ligase